jgi:hypothetical protein
MKLIEFRNLKQLWSLGRRVISLPTQTATDMITDYGKHYLLASARIAPREKN